MDTKLYRSEVLDILNELKHDITNLRSDGHEFTHGVIETAVPLDDVIAEIVKSIENVKHPKEED